MTWDYKHFILSHLIWVIAAVVAVFAFYSWRGEHDQRLLAEQAVKVADARVETLQTQIANRDKQAVAQIAPTLRIIHDTVTVPQAIKALPDVMTEPLPLPVIPMNDGLFIPQQDVLPIFQQVADDKVCRVLLTTAQGDLADTREIVKEREKEIVTLKQPKSFWKRLKNVSKVAGVCVAVGVWIGTHV
jgi:hypothetical protein